MDLEGTYLKTPFHIALFRMKLRSHCTFFQHRISAMPEIRADLFLAISQDWNVFVNFISFINVLLFWFPADQGLKKLLL